MVSRLSTYLCPTTASVNPISKFSIGTNCSAITLTGSRNTPQLTGKAKHAAKATVVHFLINVAFLMKYFFNNFPFIFSSFVKKHVNFKLHFVYSLLIILSHINFNSSILIFFILFYIINSFNFC